MIQAKSTLFDNGLLGGDEILQLLVWDAVDEGCHGSFVMHDGVMLPMI